MKTPVSEIYEMVDVLTKEELKRLAFELLQRERQIIIDASVKFYYKGMDYCEEDSEREITRKAENYYNETFK